MQLQMRPQQHTEAGAAACRALSLLLALLKSGVVEPQPPRAAARRAAEDCLLSILLLGPHRWGDLLPWQLQRRAE